MIRGIKGVKDILPADMARWQVIEQGARRIATVYGYQEIRIPIFEMTELFARSIGATTDIVEKEMYSFPDRDGTSLTLRPEGTAGTVRAFIEHNLAAQPVPQKFFYFGPMFRHERPQAGRLRQFHQFGVEFFGTVDPRADVEVIALLWRFLSELGLSNLTLEVNSLGYAEDRPKYKSLLLAFLKQREARLCSNCRRRMDSNPLRVLDCKVPECRAATEDAPKLTDHISSGAKQHFESVLQGLTSIGIPYHLNSRLVRGLDYYTLTTFEITSPHLGAQNAVGAGGRYDELVEALGGPKTPAIGFAVGLERVSLMLAADVVPVPPALIYVAGFGGRGNSTGLVLLHELRALGVRADTDYRASSLKAHLRQADRLQAAWSAIVGDDEVSHECLLLRNMRTKEQEEVPLEAAAKTIQARSQSA
ncbi:MAG: histidine--tRNA ligase [Nitrospiraceae bacterium]